MPLDDVSKQSISLTELISKIIDTGCALAILYVSMNPHSIEQAIDWATDKWHSIQHSASVSQAIRAIRDLPETEDSKVTGK